MWRLLDPAALEVVAHVAQHLLAERDLRVYRGIATEAGSIHRVATLLDALQHGDADLAHALEERVHPAGGQPWLIDVQQRVVARLFVAVAVGHLALERDHAREQRGEGVEIVVRARLAPGGEASACVLAISCTSPFGSLAARS